MKDKLAMIGNSPFTQQMMKGSGLPGYAKGGPVKKDGYLTDKKLKPYARVHRGEKVVPSGAKTKKAWVKVAGHLGLMDPDAHMLIKVLDGTAAMALTLKKRIAMGKRLPSWAEYKAYKAHSGVQSALASTHTMRDHMPRIRIAIRPAARIGAALKKLSGVKL